MRPEDRGRWAAAMAAARKRWQTGRPAERVRVQDELDALWDELNALDTGQSSGQSIGQSSGQSSVGPKHSALGALVRPGRV
jgi:hypothetical protein